MSKGNGWVPIDKMLAANLPHINRPFSRIEAMFSYTVDRNNGELISIIRYARQWQWSRCKVRKFLKDIHSASGSTSDGKGNDRASAAHFIDQDLWRGEPTENRHRTDTIDSDIPGTSEGESTQNRHRTDTTNNPNPNPKDNDSPRQESRSCPHRKIISIFQEELPHLPQVKPELWRGKRKAHLKARWDEDDNRQNLDWWRGYFRLVADTPFLLGENGRGWTANLGWLVNQRNMAKVLEGDYKRNTVPETQWN